MLDQNYQLIENVAELEQFCEQAKKKSVIMLDTEFVRTRSLYPQLGLIQAYDGESLVLIDPVEVTDMSSFWSLLTLPSLLKVLHSCSEDLEVFKTYAKVMPKPMLDTQIAAAFLGLGTSLGFGALVNHVTGVELDKGEARTDWMARPLSQKQLVYAANDALYLMPVYEFITAELDKAGRLDMVMEESTLVVSKRSADVAYANLYKDIKNSWQLNPQGLAILKNLAEWRKKQAEKRNLAINFIVKEHNLIAIAKRKPKTLHELKQIPDMLPQEIRHHGNALVKIVLESMEIPSEDFPKSIKRLVDFPEYKKVFKSAKGIISQASSEHGLPEELIGSKKQINAVLSWLWKYNDSDKEVSVKPDLLKGWRSAVAGEKLLAFLNQK